MRWYFASTRALAQAIQARWGKNKAAKKDEK
jgi:hypothetical protein